MPAAEKVALSVQDVSQLCGISQSLVRKLVRDGVLPRVPHTDRLLIARTAVERWVESAA